MARNGTTPGAAGDQQQRTARWSLPDEVAADWSAELERVTRPELVGQVRRDLPVVEPLDGQEQLGVLGTGRDRVAALRLIAVLGGEPDIDVLPGVVAGPGRRFEQEA